MPPQGFSVTPVARARCRRRWWRSPCAHTGAAAGVQITASHNPPADNGYKVYSRRRLRRSSPPPTARSKRAIAALRRPTRSPARPVEPGRRRPGRSATSQRAARGAAHAGSVRVALTRDARGRRRVALRALRAGRIRRRARRGGAVRARPGLPHRRVPQPRGARRGRPLLALAADVGADIAIALDPDADRCAVGIPTPTGWRMLTGDETGWLLGDYILSHAAPGTDAVVASTVVSSRMLAAIAAALRRACTSRPSPGSSGWRAPTPTARRRWSTPTRRRSGTASTRMRCATRTASAPPCWSATWWPRCRRRAARCPTLLDDLARRHGVHVTSRGVAPGRRRRRGRRGDGAAARRPRRIGWPVIDLRHRSRPIRTDALILTGGDDDDVGAGGGAPVGHRAEIEVLHRSSLRGDRRPGGRAAAGASAARRLVGRSASASR